MTRRLGLIALLMLGALDGVALYRLTPSPGELSRGIAAPHAWVNRVGADAAIGAAAGALLWLTALWLMLGLLITLASRFAGRPRGLLDAISRRITPALIRRLVTAATGASLVLNPTVTSAAPMASVAPMASAAPMVATSAVGTPMAAATAGPSSSTAGPSFSTVGPPSTPSLPEQASPAPPLDPEPAAGTVLVQPGDSLWRITAEQLGPSASDQQIALDWPYWYRANRRVIGRDPNLLRPGERLIVPTAPEGS